MTSFILTLLTDVLSGAAMQRGEAAETIENPPRHVSVRRWATLTLVLFLVASICLLVAALADWFAGNRFLSGVFGWAGVICLNICMICGLRCVKVRNAADEQE